MTAPLAFPPAPLATPLVQQGGVPTTTWSRWLQQLQAILKGSSPPVAWANISWATNWSNTVGFSSRYRMDANRVVWVEIHVTAGAGAGGTDIPFTFPSAFWPAQQIDGVALSTSIGSTGFRWFVNTMGQFGIRACGGTFGAGDFRVCAAFSSALVA